MGRSAHWSDRLNSGQETQPTPTVRRSGAMPFAAAASRRRLASVTAVLTAGLLAAACGAPPAPTPSGDAPAAAPILAPVVGLPPAGSQGACRPLGASAAAAAVGDDDGLSVQQAAVAARDAATEAIADPELPGERGSVPVVVTALRADGTPEIRQLVVSGPAAAADEVREVTIDTVAQGGEVVAVEPDAEVHVDGAPVTNDPHRGSQWALNQFEFEPSWARGNGTGACVAVVDSGVQVDHPDLWGKVVASANFTGESLAIPGAHGTHVAGIIAAVPDNGAGIVGAAPGADLLNAKALNSAGNGYDSSVASAITWSVDQGAHIVNLSLGSACIQATTTGCLSSGMRTAIEYARNRGVLIVAAGGNTGESTNTWSSPAAHDWSVAVAAVASNGSRASFSTRAAYVDVAAPGASIVSTVTNGYGSMSGTSMAAPYVSAALALAKSAHPSASAAQLRDRLVTTATDRGTGGHDPDFGWGIIAPLLLTA
jgi:subtilisin family serine protease